MMKTDDVDPTRFYQNPKFPLEHLINELKIETIKVYGYYDVTSDALKNINNKLGETLNDMDEQTITKLSQMVANTVGGNLSKLDEGLEVKELNSYKLERAENLAKNIESDYHGKLNSVYDPEDMTWADNFYELLNPKNLPYAAVTEDGTVFRSTQQLLIERQDGVCVYIEDTNYHLWDILFLVGEEEKAHHDILNSKSTEYFEELESVMNSYGYAWASEEKQKIHTT